jgi:hypothetical protein
MLTREKLLARAALYEAMAAKVSDTVISAGYIELAQVFREMADTAATTDEDVQRVVERFIEKGLRCQ